MQYLKQMLTTPIGEEQLKNILFSLRDQNFTGVMHLQLFVRNRKRFRVLVWQSGKVIFGGIKPDLTNILKLLSLKLQNPKISNDIIDIEESNKESIVAVLKKLVAKQILTWEQIESVLREQIVLTLEQVLPYAGHFVCNRVEVDDFLGFDVDSLIKNVASRQSQWLSLKPLIPSGEAVPNLQANALSKISNLAIRRHLEQCVDGKRSLVHIAASLHKDPLVLAQFYWHWVQAGWVVMQEPPASINSFAPTILAIDDSPAILAEIQRLLSDYCRVLVSGNATDALNLIYKEQISLILLDIAMPQTDGIELCRTLRGMAQFHDLPIIMLTARDKFADRIKGRLAGSTEYLTKPCDALKLRQLVSKYVQCTNANPSLNRVQYTSG